MPLQTKTTEMKPCVFTIHLNGSLDSTTYTVLESKIDYLLREGGARVITLDMAGLEFLSSMGVRVVLKTKKDLAAINGELLMVHLQPQITKVFEIINAIPSMSIFSSIEELDAYLARIQSKA